MPIYITMMKLTDQGIKDIKNAPARFAEGVKGLEAVGGKMLGFYLTMGEYDYVAITEGPSDEVALAYLLVLGMQGNVRTNTIKAFPQELMAEMVKKLP